MNSYFSIDFSSEVYHGDFFSVFADDHDSYWVVSNEFPLVFKGPLDMVTALKLAISSNEHFNILVSKGLYLK